MYLKKDLYYYLYYNMNDKLVYDLSLETEGVPNVFIRKDWLNILDNQNGNYQGNQSVIDTSQISNSNKFMNYREGYLAIPLFLSAEVTGTALGTATTIGNGGIGLKNWFGNIIHSFTLDYNGSTVIQQTNFINMWNSFRLLTSLSYDDILLHGSTIGFYPDTPDSFKIEASGVCSNNDLENGIEYDICTQNAITASSFIGGNNGLTKRIKNINFDVENTTTGYGEAISSDTLNTLWLSQFVQGNNGATSGNPFANVSAMAIIYLKHISTFFNFVPLLKGAFMKMTMNFNAGTNKLTFVRAGSTYTITNQSSSVASGGIIPLQIPSVASGTKWLTNGLADAASTTISYNLSIGSKCTDNTLTKSISTSGKVANNIYLYVPAYSFNPQFYESYISSSPKRVVYTDVYQYVIPTPQKNFNVSVSNGIPNIKSVLVIPFLKSTVGGTTIEQYQSVLDSAGAGTTAPLTHIKNFQVQISGQNTIYNNQQYTFEEFNNQLLGCNAVNGGLTDGLTSGFVDFNAFKNSYCYYYVNVERMLPSEKNVPKNVQISGQMMTEFDANKFTLMVFVEYENQMVFDLQTGARVE